MEELIKTEYLINKEKNKGRERRGGSEYLLWAGAGAGAVAWGGAEEG